MTKEQYFNLKEGDVLKDENGREVYVAIDMLGLGTPDDVPIGYVIMAYEEKLYSGKYIKICRNELEKWEHTGINVRSGVNLCTLCSRVLGLFQENSFTQQGEMLVCGHRNEDQLQLGA